MWAPNVPMKECSGLVSLPGIQTSGDRVELLLAAE
jgi:hypothetical protein